MKRDRNQTSPTLAEFIKTERKKRKLSAVDIERNSGGAISDSYISRIENGEVTNVSVEKLDALAKGLGVSDEDVYRAARGLPPVDPEDRLEMFAETFDGKELSKFDWLEIEAIVRTIIEQKKLRKERESSDK